MVQTVQSRNTPFLDGRPPRHAVIESLLRDRPVALHFKVREYILGRLATGALRPGEQVPTEAELVQLFGVSRPTVRQALTDLVNAGVIYRRPGLGTFVAEPRIEQELQRLTGFVEDMQALGLQPSARVVKIETTRVTDEIARHLDLVPGEAVTHVQRVRLANDQPVSFDDTYLPKDLGQRIAGEDLEVYPIFALLEEKYGLKLREAEYVVEASSADRVTARHLGLRVGQPIFLIERTSYSMDGRPVDYERLYYRGDRVRYRMRLRR